MPPISSTHISADRYEEVTLQWSPATTDLEQSVDANERVLKIVKYCSEEKKKREHFVTENENTH